MVMAIIKKVLVQDATYWGTPAEDGYGKHTFAAPVAIKVRWDDVQEKFVNTAGEEEISKAKVMVGQDMDLGGYLYLGTSASTNPEDLDGAWPIKAFKKIPEIASKVNFFRQVMLA